MKNWLRPAGRRASGPRPGRQRRAHGGRRRCGADGEGNRRHPMNRTPTTSWSPPASPVMTLLLVLEAIDDGRLALDDMVTVLPTPPPWAAPRSI